MGATFSLPIFSPEASAAFDKLPTELLLRMVRIVLRDDPLAVCRLLCSSRALQRLVHEDSEEAAELRAARSLLTQQRLHELREAAGLEGSVVPALVRSISRQLSFVKQPPAPTTTLDLSRGRVYLGVSMPLTWRVSGEARGRTVARFLRVSGALTSLALAGICDESAAAIAEAMKVNGVLRELHLDRDCTIGSFGAAAIAAALTINGALTDLRLASNCIGDAGATAIAEALRFNGALTDLRLASNHIGDAGAAAIAEALRFNGALAALNLGWNQVSDEGAAAIAEALKVNGALTDLDLSHNKIGVEGADELADFLRGGRYRRGAWRANGALTMLNLAGNEFNGCVRGDSKNQVARGKLQAAAQFRGTSFKLELGPADHAWKYGF